MLLNFMKKDCRLVTCLVKYLDYCATTDVSLSAKKNRSLGRKKQVDIF